MYLNQCQQYKDMDTCKKNIHLIQLGKLEFQFIGPILGILQYALKLLRPVIVLDPLFEFSSFPLVAVGFGLQIVQSTVCKL